MRHALGHGPARRVGTPAPLLVWNRAHQLVETRLRAAIFVGDLLELRMHVRHRLPVSSPFPASVAIPRSPGRSPAFCLEPSHTPPPRPAPGLSSRKSAPGSHAGTAALRSAGPP